MYATTHASGYAGDDSPSNPPAITAFSASSPAEDGGTYYQYPEAEQFQWI